MQEVNRRLFMSLFALGNAAAVLAACSHLQTQEQQVVTLQQFKAYSDAAADAAIASIQAAEADPRYAEVARVLGPYAEQLQQVRQQVDSLTVADLNARAIAQHVLKLLQQVSAAPQVLALLGPAGVVFSLALTIISNFVDDLPPPAGAPLRPPAQLHERAMALRARLHRSPR